VLREDPSRRGRGEGEIIRLLGEGVRRAGMPEERIHQVADELKAADACMALARPGDLVVLTPTEVEDMWRQVLSYRVRRGPDETVTRHEVLPPEPASWAPREIGPERPAAHA
jgi:cyanophycin synthetase